MYIKGNMTCPHCKHNNCYSEYSDGYFCWSEHKSYPKGKTMRRFETVGDSVFAAIPSIESHTMPDIVINYFKKYNITLLNTWMYKAIYFNKFRNRLIYTFRDPRTTERAYWQARSLCGKTPKVYTKKVYNIPAYPIQVTRDDLICTQSIPDGYSTVILTEDIVSAIKVYLMYCHNTPYEHTICVLSLNGTNIAKSIKITNKNVIIWLDSDEAGNIATTKLAKTLSVANKVVTLSNEVKKDPKDTDKRDILSYINTAMSAIKII